MKKVESRQNENSTGNKAAKRIGFVFLMIPLFWVLGIEQLLWPILTTVLLLTLPSIKLTRTAKLGLWFIAFYIVSGLFIVEPIRYISFIHTLLIYVSGLLLFIYVTNSVKNFHQIKTIIWSVTLFAFISSGLGLLTYIGIIDVTFDAPIQYILPKFLRNTGTGQAFIEKRLGTPNSWFPGIGSYTRITAFSLWATLYAGALVIMIPLQLFLVTQFRGWRKTFVSVSVSLSLLNLLFTTARGAMLGLLVGGGAFLYYRYFRHREKVLLLTGTFIVTGIILSLPLVFPELPSKILSNIDSFENTYIKYRSQKGRMFLWEKTITSWAERPIFGWGTQRDFPEMPVPLGSHSTILGTLYKQGIIGLIFHLIILLTIFQRVRLTKSLSRGNGVLNEFIDFVVLAFVANLVHQMFEFMALDAITYHLMWLMYGMIVCSAEFAKNTEQVPVNSNKQGQGGARNPLNYSSGK